MLLRRHTSGFLWLPAPLVLVAFGHTVPLALGLAHRYGNADIENHQGQLVHQRPFLAPVMGYVAISTYMLVINETNINGYIVNVFHTAIFYSIFRLKTEKMEAFMTFLCKVMGGLLLVSIPAFFLYLVGFPFVGVDAVYGDDLYSYTNYFLFMIDDRTLWAFFPRFSSVFLEPGHLGTAATLLLSTQFGSGKNGII